MTFTYTYNNANRLKTVSQSGNLLGTYTYNGREQLATRAVTNSGSANGTIHTVHDQWGNIIAELDATGATVREYIWLVEAEIAPTRGSRTTVDRPIAVVSNVNTTPALLMVHVDHLNRPVKMTNSSGTIVWNAVWQPWGGAHTLSGAEALNARFPGQWFQLEAGLHYNWHRHYDPSLGRYTQPDPLGFVDGPSVYAYARSSPYKLVDPKGLYGMCPPGQSQRPDPRYPNDPTVYTCVPDKPDEPPYCAGGKCRTTLPDCACYQRCFEERKYYRYACTAYTMGMGIPGGGLICRAATAFDCEYDCRSECEPKKCQSKP